MDPLAELGKVIAKTIISAIYIGLVAWSFGQVSQFYRIRKSINKFGIEGVSYDKSEYFQTICALVVLVYLLVTLIQYVVNLFKLLFGTKTEEEKKKFYLYIALIIFTLINTLGYLITNRNSRFFTFALLLSIILWIFTYVSNLPIVSWIK